jgi:puromycin-sensitive aminopeptidase
MLDHLLRLLSASSRPAPVTRRRALRSLSDAARNILGMGVAGWLADILGAGFRPLLARPPGEEPESLRPRTPSHGGDRLDPYRLPTDVIPTRYDLYLEPDLATFTFTGVETVAVTVRAPTSEIVLNAVELEITDATIAQDAGERHRATVELDEAAERCRLTFAATLTPGTWRLRLSFKGLLNDKLRGFYRSTYKDQAGTAHVLATTQFEATDARRAFPCWDEPAFKAVFAVTLAIPPSLTAVSNTAPASERNEGGKKVLQFRDTIRMSTYLVAFVVGDLEATDPVRVGNTPLRVWSVPGKRKLAAFGREIGAFSLRFFEEYYGLPYPSDKLDLIAIPDFASGAMENLGAIMFRENALLVEERAATHAELERVADVVAHENAHMWFGDLVTMSWWNGLWLNEAFATFMEMLAVDAWKPEWQRWTTFGVSRGAALVVDGLHSTRPIEYPVRAPRDADAMFDVLTYEKGASVLRMLEQHMGPDSFRAGVRGYLKAHAYDNADTGDLWTALGQASKQRVPELMDGWIFRPGYPLISVKLDGESRLVLTQARFTYLPAPMVMPFSQEAGGESPKSETQNWHIPVQVRIVAQGRSSTQRLLLTGGEASLNLPKGFESVLLNEGGHGFYRVRYQAGLLERLLRAPDRLAAIERFNLVNDPWAATVAGLMPATDYLDLTAGFRAERDRNVWAVLIESFHTLHRLVEPADRPRVEALVRDRLRPAVDELGWVPRDGEDELRRQLRGDLLRAIGTIGNDREVQARAATLYDESVRKGQTGQQTSVDPNVLPALIAILAHSGDAQRYEEFLQAFRTAATPQEERRYLYALAAFRQPALLEKTLARTINGEFRTQDAPFIVRLLLTSVYGRDLAWRFVKTNWDVMDRQFPKQGLRRMCEGFTGLTTPELEQDVHRFIADRKIDLGGKTLAQYLEQLRIAVTLRERERSGLASYLKAFA